ncbi:protein phosphatase 2C [Synechococcus sp. PCC 7335]|nr:protein phosphatase 2C [Synechococcus sp. PCC 7335]
MLNNRYLLKHDRIFLDTKPGLVPEAPVDISGMALPYLYLSVYPLHVPRLYAAFETSKGDPVLLLESSAFSMADSTTANVSTPMLLPTLATAWTNAPPLRQLSWLWQIAQMWESFQDEGVAATLLNDHLVRVDGSVVRLLELTADLGCLALDQDGSGAPTLVSLAHTWQPLVTTAHLSVRAFLAELCDCLEQGQLNAQQLCDQLALAITICAEEQSVAYDLAVYTDQGPTRKRNEDACFPESGTSLTLKSDQTTAAPQLLIVCDGIGGHQGGDIASKLAIATIKVQLAPIMSSALSSDSTDLSSIEIMLAIEQAICAANDEISAQNDQAHRQARNRMGTTLVLALIRGAEVYIAHLGDSRAYRISQHSCQQVTLDDDVASRQVRLGGSLYREMLIQPGAGSLVQALGMGPSKMLRPTVQRFVLDESCVFLLCSDGLSDSDRVEQFWVSVLKPLVDGGKKVDEVAQQLVSLANEYNGHDNVTVGLLAARVLHNSERMVPTTLATQPKAAHAPGETVALPHPHSSQMQLEQPITKRLEPRSVSSQPPAESSPVEGAALNRKTSQVILQKVGLIVLLLGVLAALAYTLLPGLRRYLLPASPDEPPAETSNADAGPSILPVPESPIASIDFVVGDYLRIRQSRFAEPITDLQSEQIGSCN